jgi:hypothetical protein
MSSLEEDNKGHDYAVKYLNKLNSLHDKIQSNKTSLFGDVFGILGVADPEAGVTEYKQ